MKNIRIFLSENFQFLEVKLSMYMNRRVFEMYYIIQPMRDSGLSCNTFSCALEFWNRTDFLSTKALNETDSNAMYSKLKTHLSCTKIQLNSSDKTALTWSY